MIRSFWEFASYDVRNYRTYLLIGLLSLLVFYNYSVDLEDTLNYLYLNSWMGLLAFTILFGSVYLLSIIILRTSHLNSIFPQPTFWILTVSTFVMIGFYQSSNFWLIYKGESELDYFTQKLFNRIYSLMLYGTMIVLLGIVIGKSKFQLYGLFQFHFQKKAYFYLLLAMVPIVAWAASQPEFVRQYPNLHWQAFSPEEYLGKFLIFEPFYLLDFVGVEWLFRGFLVMAFTQFLGRETVLAAAVVYCVFHFGKPLLECVSSFFGGYILGYISYKSKSIWGGIIVHMGIAFMMDVFAIISTFAK